MFIFRWSSNFMKKVVLEREHGGQDGISCLPPCIVYYYCIESESEQIITKLPWSIKDNNN